MSDNSIHPEDAAAEEQLKYVTPATAATIEAEAVRNEARHY